MLKWLLAPSKIPSAPPMYVTIWVCGVGYNTVERHWLVVGLSFALLLLLPVFRAVDDAFTCKCDQCRRVHVRR